ncbi:MAG: hypothetical protein P8Y67_04400 [Alphaproteobacteria bacterium]
MNQVSWRRILERAEDNLPAEEKNYSPRGYAPVTGARPASATSLENDLRSALEKASSRSYEPPAPPMPAKAPTRPQSQPQSFVRSQAPRSPATRLHQPIRPQHSQQQLVVHPQPPHHDLRPREMAYSTDARPTEFGIRNLPVPVATPTRHNRRRRHPEPKRGGMRNFLVISLSTAIFAFAVKEIGVQWRSLQADASSPTQVAANMPDQPKFTGTVKAGVMPNTLTFQAVPSDGSDVFAPKASDRLSVKAEKPAVKPSTATPDQIRTAARALKEENARELTEMKAPPPKHKKRAALTPMEEQVLMRRATAFLEAKDIAGARMILEYLAGRRSAVGAYSLAKTYDARFIGRLGVIGVMPDQARAQKWYKTAASYGSKEAKNYLKTQ